MCSSDLNREKIGICLGVAVSNVVWCGVDSLVGEIGLMMMMMKTRLKETTGGCLKEDFVRATLVRGVVFIYSQYIYSNNLKA